MRPLWFGSIGSGSKRWWGRLALGAVLAAASVACGDGGADATPSRTARLPSRAPAPSAAPDAPEPETIDVAGLAMADHGVVLGRAVVLVDARGTRTRVLTDDGSGFQVQDVVPPYDLAIEEAPSGPPSALTTTVYLGLTREDPFLMLPERVGPPPRAPATTLRVRARLPPCHHAPCWISAASKSASGAGGAAASFVDGDVAVDLELEHVWDGEDVAPGEAIELHLLAGDATFSEFAYARSPQIAAPPGETVDLATIPLASVAATGPMVVSARRRAPDPAEGDAGAPAPWALASWIDLPGGGELAFRTAASAQLVTRLPRLPGATFGVAAWTQPVTGATLARSSRAWRGAVALGPGDVMLEVPAGPELLRPQPGGTLSRQARGLAWASAPDTLVQATLRDVGRDRLRFRLFTGGGEIPFGRLEALGVPRPDPGAHELRLVTTRGSSVDALTDPGPDEDGRPARAVVAGASSTTRVSFEVVTP